MELKAKWQLAAEPCWPLKKLMKKKMTTCTPPCEGECCEINKLLKELRFTHKHLYANTQWGRFFLTCLENNLKGMMKTMNKLYDSSCCLYNAQCTLLYTQIFEMHTRSFTHTIHWSLQTHKWPQTCTNTNPQTHTVIVHTRTHVITSGLFCSHTHTHMPVNTHTSSATYTPSIFSSAQPFRSVYTML